MDLDGPFSYSPVRTVAIGKGPARSTLAVYPTQLAAGQLLSYAYTGPALPTGSTLEIVDAARRRVAMQPLMEGVGTLAVAVPTPGWYWVRVPGTVARFYRP